MVYNVGVVGYGLSAKIFHIPFINDAKAFKLYAIVQRSPKPDDDASKDHPGVQVYRSIEELVADTQVNVVILTTTPATHHDLAVLAMKHGKHVLVEKPFTPTSKEAQDLVKVSRQHNVLLTVYQNRRYDSDFLTLKSLIDDATLGRLVEFETHFDRHRPDMPTVQSWKTNPEDYSAVFDLGTHLMDQVVSLFGLPARITGFVGTQRGAKNTSGLEDSFTALMHYPTGLTAIAKAAVVSAEIEQLRFWVRGEKGSFKKFHLDPQEDQLKTGLRPGDKGYAMEDEKRYGTLMTVDGDGKITASTVSTVSTSGYTAFYDQFADALDARHPASLPVDPVVAANVIRLVELVRQSSEEGRTLAVLKAEGDEFVA